MIRYQVTDGSGVPALRADVDFIQIREPGLTTRELVRLVMSCPKGPRVLVNDRADIALACGAAGVHLKSGSVAPEVIRRLGRLIVTVACHNEEDVMTAEGADYAILSPIFKPMSKNDLREPLGLAALERIARRATVPVIALGGITQSNAQECIAAGAAGVAGISMFA